MTPPHVRAQIRDAADLAQVVRDHGTLLRVRSRVGMGCCPIHQEDTPSFQVNMKGHRHQNRFRCHGCGAHGDVFDFLQAVEGITLAEAIRRVASDCGLSVDGIVPETPAQRAERRRIAEEKEFCAWWFRQKWKVFREALNREMQFGPPEYESSAYRLCCWYGSVLRWIESNQALESGLRVFRLDRRSVRSFQADRARLAWRARVQSEYWPKMGER